MNRQLVSGLLFGIGLLANFAFAQEAKQVEKTTAKTIRVGIIGLDTSHSTAFAEMLNGESPSAEFANCRVVAAYPRGSQDIKSSVERIPEYTEKVKKLGVEIVDSIEALLEKVDCVLLETNDGRPHLEQFRLCIKAGKPTFIDKPVAASLEDVVAIFKEAEAAKVPVFTSSSLRFAEKTLKARNKEYGLVEHCVTTSPASVEATHPLLYWYGIHGCESLFTIMGTGCQSVTARRENGKIVAEGKWKIGNVGEFREGDGYSGTIQTAKGSETVGAFDGYKPLLVEIVKFFRTGQVPVEPAETIELYAFMSAAEESLKAESKPVSIDDVLKRVGYTRPEQK